MRELLDHSFHQERGTNEKPSRLTFLADNVFAFTAYDNQMSELFASKALEVCAAVTEQSTFDYIKDADNYRWFLLMVNTPFFAERLDCGTSIRGAWWAREDQTLQSCGTWRSGEQARSVTFSSDEWPHFVRALVAFARDSDSGSSAANPPKTAPEQCSIRHSSSQSQLRGSVVKHRVDSVASPYRLLYAQ